MKEFRASVQKHYEENQKLMQAQFKQIEEQRKIEMDKMAQKIANMEKDKRDLD